MIDSEFLAEYVHGHHTTDDYTDRFLHDGVFEAAFADCPTELRERSSAALQSAFLRLDAIPRTDPLWAGSNDRPTFTKLREHEKSAEIDDRHLESCWSSFVIAMCSGNLDRFQRASDVLLRTGQLGVSDVLRASFNLLAVSGWETDELAAGILVRHVMGAAARAALGDIGKNSSPDGSLWAGRVLRRLGDAG